MKKCVYTVQIGHYCVFLSTLAYVNLFKSVLRIRTRTWNSDPGKALKKLNLKSTKEHLSRRGFIRYRYRYVPICIQWAPCSIKH